MPWGLTRFQRSGQSHFVTFCCYHRRRLLTTDSSRLVFESALERARRSFRLHVYGYVVMPEHVHLLLSEPQRNIDSSGSAPLKPKDGLNGPPTMTAVGVAIEVLRLRECFASRRTHFAQMTSASLSMLGRDPPSAPLRAGFRLRECFASRRTLFAQDDKPERGIPRLAKNARHGAPFFEKSAGKARHPPRTHRA